MFDTDAETPLASSDDAPSAEEITRRKGDFSWNGLRHHPWAGWWVLPCGKVIPEQNLGHPSHGRPATLQDYWAEEREHLIPFEGQQWTRIHYPFARSDGSPTDKAGWSAEQRGALAKLVRRKIAKAGPTLYGYHLKEDGYDDLVISEDNRAQLDGAALLDTPLHPLGRDTPVHATFVRAELREAEFDSQIFGPGTVFRLTNFNARASFQGCVFQGYANFLDAKFQRDALFLHSRFLGDVAFQETKFSKGKAAFQHTRFSEIANFKDAVFNGSLDFRSAHFADAVEFQGAQFSTDPGDWTGAFFDATAKRLVNFTRQAHFIAFALFDGAGLEGGFRIDEGIFAKDAAFQRALKAAKRQGRTDTPAERNHRFAQLERGCRALKDGAAKRNAHTDQHRFFRYELAARSCRSDSPRLSRLLLRAYGSFSDYGTSLTKPLAWLVGVALIYAAAYYLIARSAAVVPPLAPRIDIVDGASALQYSIRNVIRGLLPAASGREQAWAEMLHWAWGPVKAPIIQLITASQTLWSLIMIFLFGLAARRRFQSG